jgi:hypothetical protein
MVAAAPDPYTVGESARRFEEVQEAYAAVRRLRQNPSGATARGGSAAQSPRDGSTSASPDPSVEVRLAEMERELQAARRAREHAVRQAHAAREQAMRAARQAAPSDQTPRDEELGYISTDDSFSKILDDAAAELSQRLSGAKRSPAGRRVADLIDELSARLAGERRDPD